MHNHSLILIFFTTKSALYIQNNSNKCSLDIVPRIGLIGVFSVVWFLWTHTKSI